MTALVHGDAELARVQAASQALFGQGDLRALDPGTLAAAVTEVPHAELEVPPGALPPVADLMVATGIVASKSAARRAIAEGGAYLNNDKVTAEDAVPGRDGPAARRVPGAASREADRRGRAAAPGLTGRAEVAGRAEPASLAFFTAGNEADSGDRTSPLAVLAAAPARRPCAR